MRKLHSLIIVCLGALSCAECVGMDPAARRGFDEALRSVEEHRFPSPELIKDPVNREWVENLRGGALEGIGGPGDVLFLNLGDPEVMQRYLEMYHTAPWKVTGVFSRTIQPKVIVAIADDFYRDEPVTLVGESDFRDHYPSMRACLITQRIIKNSPVFNERLKEWVKDDPFAKKLRDEVAGRVLRDGMRVWWAENRALFEAERYADVKPPSIWTPEAASAELEEPVSTFAQRISPTPVISRTPLDPRQMSETEVKSPSTLPWIIGSAIIAAIIIGALVMRRKM